MGETGVGGCTFPKHRVQPWDFPYPHDLLPSPPTGGVFTRGAAAEPKLKLLLLHEGSPSSPHQSSQAFPAPFPPKGFWELTESPQAPSSPVFLKDLPLQVSAARRGEVQVYPLTVCCHKSWRDLLTVREWQIIPIFYMVYAQNYLVIIRYLARI